MERLALGREKAHIRRDGFLDATNVLICQASPKNDRGTTFDKMGDGHHKIGIEIARSIDESRPILSGWVGSEPRSSAATTGRTRRSGRKTARRTAPSELTWPVAWQGSLMFLAEATFWRAVMGTRGVYTNTRSSTTEIIPNSRNTILTL